VQKTFTVIKVGALLLLIAAALFGGHAVPSKQAAGAVTASGFGGAMIFCVTAFDGWVSLSFVAGEIKEPRKNLPLALAIGLTAVIAIYVLANVAYLRVLSVSEIAAADRVGAQVAERLLGAAGGKFVAFSILMSIVGAANGWALTGPRIFFAQARDGLFFRALATVHPRYETPYVSILWFGAWSILLALTGTYYTLASYAMFAAWTFYALSAIGVMVLRRAQPDRPRPFRMTGYPVTLIVFALVAAGFVANTFVATPWPAVIGSLFIVSGVPVYLIWKRTK
jgi:APA family basic amino acid/polyamine antiporter